MTEDLDNPSNEQSEELTNGAGSGASSVNVIADNSANVITEIDLGRILGMKVPLIVKVAEKKMTMDQVLTLSIGGIIQFDKDAYQNIELMVNNQTIGLGQPVKIGEKFGLRLLQVGNIEDMIKSLGGGDSL